MTSDPSTVITSLSAAALLARYPGNTFEASFVAARLDGWALNDGSEDAGMGTLTARRAAALHADGRYVVGDRTPAMQRQAARDRRLARG